MRAFRRSVGPDFWEITNSGFVADSKRICVSITRYTDFLVIVGN